MPPFACPCRLLLPVLLGGEAAAPALTLPLLLRSGSHAEPVPAEAPDGKYLPPTDYPLERARPCPGPAGSVLIFNYRTIQCAASPSAPDLSPNPRGP